MRFKEWLLAESGGSGQGNDSGQFFYNLSLYPTDAFDGSDAFIDPRDVWALKSRWEIEARLGREFHNLDYKKYLSLPFTTVVSTTMPGSSKWKHKPDTGSSVRVDQNADYHLVGVKRKDSSPAKKLQFKILDDFGLPLDKLFGDKGVEPKSVDKSFDKPWRKVRENVLPYQDVGPTRTVNTGLRVPSKYIGPDETGEKGQEETEIADFGFEPLPQKLGRKAYIKGKLRRRNGISQPDNYVQGQVDPRSNRRPTS